MHKIDMVIIFSLVVLTFVNALFLGLQTPQGVGVFMFFYGVSIFVPTYLILRFLGRFSLKKADSRELEAEDSIFLQGVAFSQSTLWIVLNLIAQDGITGFLKWFVPATAVICYGMRAYAKLKNSNRWRYFSLIVLSLIFAGSLSSVIRIVLIPNWQSLMLIENVDVTSWIVIPPLAQIPVIVVVYFRTKLKIRYGLANSKELPKTKQKSS